jgi:hypothetical protein
MPKMPRIDTLHQLIADLEKRSAVIGSMELAKTPDCRLSDEVAVFANQDGEKDIIAGALEYLVNKASLDLSAAKTMLEAVLNGAKIRSIWGILNPRRLQDLAGGF